MSKQIQHPAFTFNDVLIRPNYSEIESRSRVSLSTKLGSTTLTLPIVSSNMKTITGPKMAAQIAKFGGLGLLHRFCSISENADMFNESWRLINNLVKVPSGQDSCPYNIGVSIGVKEEDKQRFEVLHEAGARIFCVDVAHGHNILVKRMLKFVNDYHPKSKSDRSPTIIIAGNVATPEAYEDLCEWGADVVKVGIGPSPVCRTRYNTGVGVPQLYALKQIYEASCSLKEPKSILADGGISHVGDIAKALKYSDAVMLGSMLSGTSETPGHVFRDEHGEFYKVYGGSASGENKGQNKFVEGVVKTVKFRGKVKYIFREIQEGLQSSFSYVGAKNISEYQRKCKFVFLSGGAKSESRI